MIRLIKTKRIKFWGKKIKHAEEKLCPLQQSEETIDTISVQLVINHYFMIIFPS